MVSVNPEEKKKKVVVTVQWVSLFVRRKLFFEIYFFRIFKNVRRDGDDESC